MTALLAVGFVTGVASGLFGVGGGFILIPLLSLLGTPLHAAVGASLIYVFFTSISGALRHLTQGTADWQLALPLMASSAATSVAGSAVSVGVAEEVLGFAFVAVTGGALVLFNSRVVPPAPRGGAGRRGRWWIARRQTAGDRTYEYAFHIAAAAATGALLGLVTGLLGIGGGFLLVPMLVALLRIPLPIAIGSSLLSILAAAAAGVAAHSSLRGLDPWLVLPLVLTGVLGAQLGARLATWLPVTRLRIVYNVLLLSTTGYMLARAIGLAGSVAATGL